MKRRQHLLGALNFCRGGCTVLSHAGNGSSKGAKSNLISVSGASCCYAALSFFAFQAIEVHSVAG